MLTLVVLGDMMVVTTTAILAMMVAMYTTLELGASLSNHWPANPLQHATSSDDSGA